MIKVSETRSTLRRMALMKSAGVFSDMVGRLHSRLTETKDLLSGRAPAARIPAGGVGTGAFSLPQPKLNSRQLVAAGRSLGVKEPANPLAARVI